MSELYWQAVLLLAGAFFLGAVIACGLKRRFYYKSAAVAAPLAGVSVGAAPSPDSSQPIIEVAPRPAEGTRFEKALTGQPAAPVPAAATPAPAAAPAAPQAPAPAPVVAAPAATPAPTPAPEPTPAAAPAPAAPFVVPPTALKVEPATPPSEPQPEAVAGIPRVSVTTGSGAPASVADGGASPSDDLTRIRGIDPIMQGRLKELGIRRFQDVASLTTSDIKGLSQTLGLDARITLENWVGQAQVLAGGGETHYSRRQDLGIPVPETAEPSSRVSTQAPAAEAQPAPVVPEPAPAEPTPVAAEATPSSNVIPMTPATPAAAPEPATAPTSPGSQWPATHDVSHLRSVRSEALVGDAAPARALGERDDLKRIRGIGVLIEKKLNSLGITHYEQVANWTGADIERISRILDFKGRIERENWIEQARILATGGQTEFSRRG